MADHPYLFGNALVCGDNIDVLRELPDAGAAATAQGSVR